MVKVGLVIVFNHRFDRNIPRLRAIYSNKFSSIIFLMPFYDGEDKDVIPVYECSYQFQGYFIQAYEKLMATGNDYFLFIGDDLILNPSLNEHNVLHELGMENKYIGISELYMLNRKGGYEWLHARFSSKAFLHNATSWRDSLPSYQYAMDRFRDFFGTTYPEVYGEDFFVGFDQKDCQEFGERNRGYNIPYPMAAAYSDLLCVKKEKLFEFSRICGIFSAMNLFVEIAIPTAIVLTTWRKDVSVFGALDNYEAKLMWDDERVSFREKYQHNLTFLQNNWNKKWLYVHPIKLSEWD